MIRLALPLIALSAGCWHKPLEIDIDDRKVRVARVKTSEAEFYWHKDVERRAEVFTLSLRGANLLENLTPTVATSTTREYLSFHRIGHICVRTIARARSGETCADFWVYVTYGHTGDPRPVYHREPLTVVASGGYQITLDAPPPNSPIAHGQGLPIRHFRFDCSTGKPAKTQIFSDLRAVDRGTLPPFVGEAPGTPWWVKDPDVACASIAMRESCVYAPFEQSYYVPAFPGMTGGQQQFGVFQVLPEINSNGYRLGSWRSQLYQEGCRPAHFLHPDGSRVTEDDYPLTVLTSSGWIHERSDGKYWIQHTHPSSPWKDKGACDPTSGRAWTFWDSQHWSLNAMCQVYHVYQDPGLRLLLGDLAEGWLWANPVTDKGTTHHHVASSARARGRVLESGCALAQVLKGDIRSRIIRRLEGILSIQMAEFRRCLDASEPPIVYRSTGASVWEHGLWVKGLLAASLTLTTRKAEIHAMGAYIGRWVLDGFKRYSGRWYVPYRIQANGSYSSTPSKKLSLWCLPAVELLNRFERPNLSRQHQVKIDQILSEFWADPPMNGGYGDQMKWRLLR